MAAPQTVADLLGGAQAAPDGAPAPPPGFVPANDQAPPPPPGFVPEQPAAQKPGSGLLANLAQGASEGIQFNGGLIRDALLNPRAIYDRAAGMASQVFGDKPAPHVAPTLGDLAFQPLNTAAAKQSASVVAASPLERVARATGAGATGAVLNPEGTVAQMLSGAAAGTGAGVASEMVPDNLKPVAALVGGAAGFGAGKMAVANRFGPKAAEVVAETPREVVLTDKGELTPDGREIAAQTGLHPDQMKAAYDHFDEVQAKTSNDNPDLPPAEPVAMAVGDGLNHAPPEEPPTNTSAQEAVPGAGAAEPAPEAATPPSALARAAEAQSEGIDLTKGQATQDFTTQESEQTLRRMAGTEEGAKAQSFYIKQQQQIADAVDRFKQAVGNPDVTAEERGAQVQDALRSLRDNGVAGVNQLYKTARDMAASLGEAGSNLIRLDTAPLLDAMRKLWSDSLIDRGVRQALKEEAARYQLIGHEPTTVEGDTTVKLRDNTGQPAGRVTFTGTPEPLTIVNAENLRQRINQMWDLDKSKQTQALKPLIDQAVQDAVERAANQAPGSVGDAFKAARKGYQVHQQTYKAGDIVQSLVGWKKGAKDVTPLVSPDAVLKKILGNDADSVSSLKKVKAVLLSSPTDKSKAAWNAIQAHAVAKVFDKAFVLNANPGEGVMGTISGAKLNSAIQAFGVDKLKVLLPQADFDQLMKLNRIIRNATVPISGTVNTSGTAYALMNFLGKQGLKLGGLVKHVPGVGFVADAAMHVVQSTQRAAKANATLKGIREFDLTQAANEDAKASKPKADPAAFVRDFIQTARDPQIIAPLMAASSTQQKDARP